MKRTATLVTLLLAAAAVAGVVSCPPSPDDGFGAVLLRGALVVPGWLLLPGLPWVLLWTARRQAASRSAVPRALTVALEAAFCSLAAQAAALTLLKLARWTPAPAPYLAAAFVPAVPALLLLARQPPVRVSWPTRTEALASLAAVAAVAAAGALWLGSGARRLESFWYHPRALEDRIVDGPTLHPEGDWGTPERHGPPGAEARVYRPGAGPLWLVADGAGETTLFLLLQAAVGAEVRVLRGDEVLARGRVETHPVEDPREGPTLRVIDRGITCAVADVRLERGDRLAVEIAAPGEGPVRLVDLTSAGYEAVWALERAGPRHVHYYQILNIAEIVSWGRETLRDRYIVLTQPPAWPYVVGPLGLLLGPDLPAAYLLTCLLLLVQALVGIQLAGALAPRLPRAALLVPVLAAVIQLRMLVDGSMANFPDPLYALAILAAILALVDGDLSLFGGAGMAAALLRYPGAFVVTAAAVLDGWLTGRDRRADRHLLAFWLPFAAAVCALVVAGAAGGRLESWWGTVWFENTTEHFHGDYRLRSLLPRIPHFYAAWYAYAGPLLLLALPVRGRRAALPLALALVYSALMCTADHLSPHYFLPLIALTGVSAAVNLGCWTAGARPWAREAIAAAGALACCVPWLL